MSGSGLTYFPAFSSNYPSTLVSLDEYVRAKYTELAHMNERWSHVETSHRPMSKGAAASGRFFEDDLGDGGGRGRTGSSLLPAEWVDRPGRPSSASTHGGRASRPKSASVRLGNVPGGATAPGGLDGVIAERQRELLGGYPLVEVGHTTGRLGARPATAVAAPQPLIVDDDVSPPGHRHVLHAKAWHANQVRYSFIVQRDVLELDGRTLTDELDIAALLMAAPNVRMVSLRRCKLLDTSLRVLPRVCPHVTHLDMSDAKGFTTEGLILTVAALVKLSGLRLGNCNHVFAPQDSLFADSEPLRTTAMGELTKKLYATATDERLERAAAAALATVAALPPPPTLRGPLGDLAVSGASGSPRKTSGSPRAAPAGALAHRALSSSIAEDEEALDDLSILGRRSAGPSPASAAVRPRSAIRDVRTLLDDAAVGRPLAASTTRPRPQSARPISAGLPGRQRPLSAYVRATSSVDQDESTPGTAMVPATGRAGAAAASLPAVAAINPVAPGAGSDTSGTSAVSIAATAAGKLLCHAVGAAPHQMVELSFSRCQDLTDDMFFAISGQTSGLADVPVATASHELFHSAAGVAEGTGAGAAAASWATRMSEVESRQAAADAARNAQLEEVRRRMGMMGGGAGLDAVAAGTDTGVSDASLLSPQLGVQTIDAPSGRRGSADVSKLMAVYKPPVCDIPLFLQVLDLTACSKLTDRALAFVGANCPSLAVLRLRFCDQPAVSDAGVASIAAGCPELLTVDLRGCAQLTNASVTALARHCPKLQRLCLAGCTNVDDAALSLLAGSRASTSLWDLDLTRCKAVTGNAAKNIMFKCPGLARAPGDGVLNLTLCSSISSAELDILLNTFSSARIICPALAETDASKPALVPTFQPPPKDEAFASRRVFAVYSVASAAGKKGAKGKKK